MDIPPRRGRASGQEICRGSAVCRHVNLLVGQGRLDDANLMVGAASQVDPGNDQFRSLLAHVKTIQTR